MNKVFCKKQNQYKVLIINKIFFYIFATIQFPICC